MGVLNFASYLLHHAANSSGSDLRAGMSPSSFLVAARSYEIPGSGLGSRTHLQSAQNPVKIRAINKKVGETRPEIVDVVISKEDMMRIKRKIQLVFFMSEA